MLSMQVMAGLGLHGAARGAGADERSDLHRYKSEINVASRRHGHGWNPDPGSLEISKQCWIFLLHVAQGAPVYVHSKYMYEIDSWSL